MNSQQSLPIHWVSASTLQVPVRSREGLCRGALILSQLDAVAHLMPKLREHFVLIERRAWRGINDAEYADIKLIEELPLIEEARKRSPNAVLLPFAPADFVDTDAFAPLDARPKWDVLQIACWAPYKRIELFVQAASLLPQLRFAHIGHFPLGGTKDELEYRKACLEQARVCAPHIDFLSASANNNGPLPSSKAEVNVLINNARIGLLTSSVEGVNRFKMECLAADKPVLVANDAPWPTRKHINESTGWLYDPTPSQLARAILYAVENANRLAPRQYLLAASGRTRAVAALRHALQQVSRTSEEAARYRAVDWDGRNQSLLWGERALRCIRDILDTVPQG